MNSTDAAKVTRVAARNGKSVTGDVAGHDGGAKLQRDGG